MGSMFVAIVAWIVLDMYGWRILVMSAAFPSVLTVLLSALYLPESPRWLLLHGQTTEANAILNEINAANTRNTDPISIIKLKPLSAAQMKKHGDGQGGTAYLELLSPKYVKTTIILGVLSLFWGLTYYGIVMFLGAMFASSADVEEDNKTTTFAYGDILTVASSEIVGIFLTSLLLDRVGRRWTQGTMYMNAALSCFCLALSTQGPTSPVVVFLSAWARISIIGASGATVVVTPELYPTEVRVPGHVVAATMSRIGTVVSPYIAQNKDLGVDVVGVVFGLINLFSVFLALTLPETMGQSVDAVDLSSNSTRIIHNTAAKSVLHSNDYLQQPDISNDIDAY